MARFGAYEILYELKTGGMGAVLLGRRRGPGAFEQLVAIKTIRPEYAQAPAVRAMFLDEAAILARLAHPGIATVHDFGEEGGTLYMVMEYVAGIAFRDVTAHGLSPAVAARAVAEACRGLHAAHEVRDLAGNLLGVVHRDISPDNLMLGFDGHVKVIDFGIALIKNRQAPVTELGTVKGKPPYMSPEQVKNEAIDRRSDVFSLAVVLWELLTGRMLFDGDSIYAVARAVEHQDIAPPSQVLGAPLPLGLDAAVMNALDRDLARRTPTAAAFAEQLEQVIQTAGDETLEAWAERALDEPRRAHRAWLAGVVSGRDGPRPIGRPTGSVTALASPVALAQPPGTAAAPVAPPVLPVHEPPPDPAVSTHLAAATHDDLDELPPRRRGLALPVGLAVLVLLMVGGAIYLVTQPREPEKHAVIAAPIDASGDTKRLVAPDAMPADAADAPVDAAVAVPPPPIDAGHRPIRPPHDAGGVVHATVPATPSPDAGATAEPASRGTGFVTIKSGATYFNVMIDGHLSGPTPMIHKSIAAGSHVIELIDPATGAVVIHRTVAISPGEAATVAP